MIKMQNSTNYEFFRDVTMMFVIQSQSISHFNVKRTIWLKGYQNGNHIEPSEQAVVLTALCDFLQPLFWRLYVVAFLVTLKPDSTLNVEITKYCNKLEIFHKKWNLSLWIVMILKATPEKPE